MSGRPRRLEGRNALIVGGTGGIGLASARRFLEEGAEVVVSGVEEGAKEAAREALSPMGTVHAIGSDVRLESDVIALFARARELLGGRIDILFHVAGISGRRFGDGPLPDASADGWDRVMEANARGVFLTNREAVRIMRGQPLDSWGIRGTVLNLGSVLSGSPSPRFFGTIAYAASKGAVRALTIAAASAHAADCIRFNLIEPGLIDTPMAARAAQDATIRRFLASKQPIAGGPARPRTSPRPPCTCVSPRVGSSREPS